MILLLNIDGLMLTKGRNTSIASELITARVSRPS